MDYWMFPLGFVLCMSLMIGYGIRCDHFVKMRELDLIEKGIIKKEIINDKSK